MKKIIHYCWFGKGEKNALIKKCINSWKAHCLDYEIKEWNEENFNINESNNYVKEAYREKKWAFVSDYVRLYALYSEGGIYLDTDVEVFENLNDLVEDKLVIGYHADNAIASATMICNKGNKIVKELLEYYYGKSFLKKDGVLNETTNIDIITEILVNKYKLNLDNTEIIKEDIHIYPKGVFTEKNKYVKNYTIHHFNASWLSKEKALEQVKSYKHNYNLTLKWLDFIINKKTINLKILDNKKISIYGNGSIGSLLISYLKEKNIEIEYIIDSIKNSNLNNGIKVIDKKNSKIKNLEFIIVTPTYHYTIIKEELLKSSNAQIISIEELFYNG